MPWYIRLREGDALRDTTFKRLPGLCRESSLGGASPVVRMSGSAFATSARDYTIGW